MKGMFGNTVISFQTMKTMYYYNYLGSVVGLISMENKECTPVERTICLYKTNNSLKITY